MLSKLWTYLQYGNRLCGIEHTSIENESIIVSLVKQSKKELHQEETLIVSSIEDVSEKLSKNRHAFLVINSDKVLSKTLTSEQKDAIKLVYKAFPNINIEHFYYEVLSEKRTHFISICRKDYVKSLVEEYLQSKIFITNVSLGNSLISTLKSFIDSKEVFSSNALIKIKDDSIISIDKTQSNNNKFYDVNGLRVSCAEILSFSAAIQSFLKKNSTVSNLEVMHNNLLNNFKQTRFFNQFLKFSGIFILGILLVNFLFFNHYFNKVNDLQEITSVNESVRQKILVLDQSVSKKQKLVDDLLKISSSRSSFYVSTIVSSMPETLLLLEYNYQPLLKRIKPDKPIVLDANTIIVSGRSRDSELFSTWISKLEDVDWIEKVDIINYGLSSNRVSDFEIKITLGK